jgi:hypothetical protein
MIAAEVKASALFVVSAHERVKEAVKSETASARASSVLRDAPFRRSPG